MRANQALIALAALLLVPSALAQSGPAPLLDSQPASADGGAAAAKESFVWSPRDGDRLDFDVFRNGEKFGRHSVAFTRIGSQLKVIADVELKVAVGPLTLFQYIHKAQEVYEAGRLVSVDASTKNDGKWSKLAAKATAGGLNVVGAKFKGVLPGPVVPSTHWNIAEMKQPAMFSTETGAMLPMTVTDQGVEKVKVGTGYVDARKFLVKSEMEATFWYDSAGRWVKCAFTTKGSKVEYVLRDLPA